jgi:hypothetical protein
MKKFKILFWLLALAALPYLPHTLRAQPMLGDAPRAPADVSGLPGGGPRPATVNGGFSVDTSSREQVRDFYNAVYLSSDGVPMNSTAVTTNCFAGTNSLAFLDATLRRINWFRALAGVPAAVTFDPGESLTNQQTALMMSANNQLQHVGIPPTWSCFTVAGTNGAAHSNLALGTVGADAITSYIWDYGANNSEVGHRRWILYPQTRIMATGDVPVEGAFNAANATWVFDANLFGPRPATRNPFVAWPPAGYVPYPVVFPQWSFALSNADLSAATVTMKSNGVPISVTIQPYQVGFGENTLVWYPSGLNPADYNSIFPFNGSDTIYSITVSNVSTATGMKAFNYTVTLFDPAVPGVDYFPPTLSGPSQPLVGVTNTYTFTGLTNATSYQWLAASLTNGNLADNAQNGLANFTISPTPNYPVITNAPVGSGSCFHLTHTNRAPQLLQLKEWLLPSTNTVLSFNSYLGYATTNETARVQVSYDGVYWKDIFAESGNNSFTDSTFTNRTLLLSNYASTPLLLRFNYDYQPYTRYYPQIDPFFGWCLKNIIITNVQQLVNPTTNAVTATNFVFAPSQAGAYALVVRALIFTEFPLNWGPAKIVTALVNTPMITLNAPVVTNGQVRIDFTVSGPVTTFKLLQADSLVSSWTTNTSALFTTNVPGSSYRFTTSIGPATRFYRVQSP